MPTFGLESIVQINCLHGYFIFQEQKAGEASRFMRTFSGVSLVSTGRYFTFETLADAESYSIAGNPYLGAVATKTFEGPPWEILRANGLVYDFTVDQVVPIFSIVRRASIDEAGKYFVSNGLILPGTISDDGTRVTDYAAWYLSDNGQFKYSEVSRV